MEQDGSGLSLLENEMLLISSLSSSTSSSSGPHSIPKRLHISTSTGRDILAVLFKVKEIVEKENRGVTLNMQE
jgi:hypothetical protein